MISVAASIKFRQYVSGTLASFDSTFHQDEDFGGAALVPYFQKILNTDTITVQVKVATGNTMEMVYSEGDGGAWQTMTGETLKTTGTVYDYYEIEIDFSTFTNEKVRFAASILQEEAIIETWISEPVEIVTTTDGLLKAEFFNFDNAFEVDYTTDIAHLIRVESELKDYRPGGESSVFDNQQEVTKIRSEVKRILVFKTEPIPRYLAEMLFAACQHDKFLVNDVEYVAETNPEVDNNASNLVTFTVNLTQRNVIGLNTHDIGYDCDSLTDTDTMVLQTDEASGQISFTVPEGYLIGYITAYRIAGSPAVIAGTTAGGSEIVSGMNLSAAYAFETATVGYPLALTGDETLYVTISGTGATATIIVLLLKNRQI